jgi:GDP-L-fucose synthase
VLNFKFDPWHYTRGLSILNIIQSLCFILKLIFNTSKPDGKMVKLTNLDKLHNLGWHHKIELNDGIKTVFNQYKTQALNNI